jgi:L-lactate dehydrogenase complex protein LldE
MRVALFVPCYIDQFYPQVAIASLELLEKLGCEVIIPENQTCCGQPMANSGFANTSVGCDTNFTKNFEGFDYIVGPSGSCILHIKEHHPNEKIRNSVFEICEFLTDVLKITSLNATFPFKVGLHQSCHGQRGLGLSSMSELNAKPFTKVSNLLDLVQGIQWVYPKRSDECCGFGGTFCVTEEAVSVKMGKDRIQEHQDLEVEFITGTDTSCLMHLEGILRRQKSKVKVIHIVEILNSYA